jgi:hypothetical protein
MFKKIINYIYSELAWRLDFKDGASLLSAHHNMKKIENRQVPEEDGVAKQPKKEVQPPTRVGLP